MDLDRSAQPASDNLIDRLRDAYGIGIHPEYADTEAC